MNKYVINTTLFIFIMLLGGVFGYTLRAKHDLEELDECTMQYLGEGKGKLIANMRLAYDHPLNIGNQWNHAQAFTYSEVLKCYLRGGK